jgi:uncharacterized protein YceH (UPF0502 family)
VQHELDLLQGREEPLAQNVGRRPGQKEERWATTLVPDPDPDQPRQPVAASAATASDSTAPTAPTTNSSDNLRAELEELRAEVADLRQEIQELRTSLGG